MLEGQDRCGYLGNLVCFHAWRRAEPALWGGEISWDVDLDRDGTEFPPDNSLSRETSREIAKGKENFIRKIWALGPGSVD